MGPSTKPIKPISQEALRNTSPVDFFKGVWGEMRKVTWPSREEAIRLTIVVIGLSVAIGAFLGALDGLLTVTFGKFVIGI